MVKFHFGDASIASGGIFIKFYHEIIPFSDRSARGGKKSTSLDIFTA